MANCDINKLWRKSVSHSSSGFSPAQQTRSSTHFGKMKTFKMREQVFNACCPDFLFSLLIIGKKGRWHWWLRLHFLYSFNSCCCNLGSFDRRGNKNKVNSTETKCTIFAHLFPWSPRELHVVHYGILIIDVTFYGFYFTYKYSFTCYWKFAIK